MHRYTTIFRKNWSYNLFVEHAELFFPILERESRYATREVSGLCRILGDLKVPNNAKILDLSCGIGRHSIILAKKGFKVTGYDPSEYYINIARKKAKSEILNNTNLRFYVGDPVSPSVELLRNKERNFDIILILFQSIGYISRKHDSHMLENLSKIASSKCYLLLETENKLWRLRNFEKNRITNYRSMQVSEEWSFDFNKNLFKNTTKFYRTKAHSRRQRLALSINTHMILYSTKELRNITTKAGWTYHKSYHNIRSLAPAETDSEMPVSVYRIK